MLKYWACKCTTQVEYPTWIRPTWASCTPTSATNSRVRKNAPRSSQFVGYRPRSGNVMIYRKLHNWRPHTRFKFLESTNEILAASDVAEMIQIKQLYLAPFGGQQSLVLKTGKHSAHSFFCDSEVIADIAARHAPVS